jgi:hypothetical protein
MSTFLLYSSYTSSTGPKLAKALGIPCGLSVPRGVTLLINYGAGSGFSIPPTVKRILNKPESIRSKYGMLQFLSKVTGVSVPKFKSSSGILNSNEQQLAEGMRLPVIGRTAVHQDGSGFFVCNTIEDIKQARSRGATYFQEQEQIAEEYRIQIIGGTVVSYKKVAAQDPTRIVRSELLSSVEEKYPNASDKEKSMLKWLIERQIRNMVLPDPNIRTPSRGWCYSMRASGTPQPMIEMCHKAIKACGMDFGAIDIIKTIKGDTRLIEINSGPGMDEGATDFKTYVEWIKRIQRGSRRTSPVITKRIAYGSICR